MKRMMMPLECCTCCLEHELARHSHILNKNSWLEIIFTRNDSCARAHLFFPQTFDRKKNNLTTSKRDKQDS